MPVFEEKKLFLRNFFFEKKTFALHGGGVVPQGGTAGGGVGPEKKSSQKNFKSEFPQKKVPEKKSKKKILVSQTSYTPHMGVFQKNSFFLSKKKIEKKKFALQGGV